MIGPMVERGYRKSYASALAAAGGCLGIIVPPSLIFIIYGVVTSTSVGDLFLGGVFTGLLWHSRCARRTIVSAAYRLGCA